MSVTEKNLQYYLTHTDEMPEDPKILERLANEHMAAALESGTEQMDINTVVPAEEPIKDEKTGGSSDAKAEVTTEVKEEVKAEVKDEPKVEVKAETPETKPEGILAKDGKNVIPYSQLESARARATAAEAMVKELTAKVAQAEAGKTTEAADESLTEDELQVLEADSPTLAKTLRSLQNKVSTLQESLKSVTGRQEQQIAQAETETKSEAQTAIDGIPTLAAWQAAEDQTMWEAAVAQDRILRAKPAFANMSFAERFKKVVQLVEVELELQPTTQVATQDKPALTAAEVKEVARGKLAGKTPVPRSLSDIPGGAPPAVDEKAKVEQMSVHELGNKFMNMSREQMDAYLQTL